MHYEWLKLWSGSKILQFTENGVAAVYLFIKSSK